VSTANTIPGLVSVVIPVFNRPAMLVEAVESVLGQSYRPLEIIVVDDGSTDDTPAAVAGLERANPEIVRSIRRSNGGPGAARESGRSVARGEFLQFLDSDDLLLPRKLELQVEALRSVGHTATCYGKTKCIRADGTVEESTRRTGEQLDSIFPAILTQRLWITATPLYLSRVCELAGGWAPLRLDEDWEFETRVGCVEPRLVFVPETICVHRDHDGARAGGGNPLDGGRLRQQAEAQLRIYATLVAANRPLPAFEARTIARRWFFLARRCAVVGSGEDASRLLFAARKALRMGSVTGGFDMAFFRGLARLFGWRAAGRAASAVDRWRVSRQPSRAAFVGSAEGR
jgi:hypothetical protein